MKRDYEGTFFMIFTKSEKYKLKKWYQAKKTVHGKVGYRTCYNNLRDALLFITKSHYKYDIYIVDIEEIRDYKESYPEYIGEKVIRRFRKVKLVDEKYICQYIQDNKDLFVNDEISLVRLEATLRGLYNQDLILDKDWIVRAAAKNNNYNWKEYAKYRAEIMSTFMNA